MPGLALRAQILARFAWIGPLGEPASAAAVKAGRRSSRLAEQDAGTGDQPVLLEESASD